ncbi:MAG: hypothetical protein PHV74_05045 [Dehalococcoidia bacterium]|nr:hypothetical protein [Dehalococcoidia bacterium]
MPEMPEFEKPNEELLKQGWKHASITGGKHLDRTLEMYEELGLEVLIEEVNPSDCGQCTVCFASGNEKMYRVYTRSGPDSGTSSENL